MDLCFPQSAGISLLCYFCVSTGSGPSPEFHYPHTFSQDFVKNPTPIGWWWPQWWTAMLLVLPNQSAMLSLHHHLGLLSREAEGEEVYYLLEGIFFDYLFDHRWVYSVFSMTTLRLVTCCSRQARDKILSTRYVAKSQPLVHVPDHSLDFRHIAIVWYFYIHQKDYSACSKGHHKVWCRNWRYQASANGVGECCPARWAECQDLARSCWSGTWPSSQKESSM